MLGEREGTGPDDDPLLGAHRRRSEAVGHVAFAAGIVENLAVGEDCGGVTTGTAGEERRARWRGVVKRRGRPCAFSMKAPGAIPREAAYGYDRSGAMSDGKERRQAATPEEIWAILREVAEGQKENRLQMQETDRRMQETDRRLRETDVRLKKLDDLFNGQWGKLMEALVRGDLIKLLRDRGVDVDHTTGRLASGNGAPQWEIDIIAANGHEVVAVEVKTTLKVGDVDHFVDTLKRFAVQAPALYRGKRVYGAVAYLRADGSSDVYAERQGLFVIRATGSSASITNGDRFTPRTFR